MKKYQNILAVITILGLLLFTSISILVVIDVIDVKIKFVAWFGIGAVFAYSLLGISFIFED